MIGEKLTEFYLGPNCMKPYIKKGVSGITEIPQEHTEIAPKLTEIPLFKV